MAVGEPYLFELECVPDEDQSSNDNSDTFKSLSTLNVSRVHLSSLEQPESENKLKEFIS